MVVAVDMPEKVSLLASCDGDRMTRLMRVFSIISQIGTSSESAFYAHTVLRKRVTRKTVTVDFELSGQL